MTKILWIENQMEYLGPHRRALMKAGYSLRVMSSAQAAYDHLKRRDTDYDLIILDILMGTGPVGGRVALDGKTGESLYKFIRLDLGLTMPIMFVSVVIDRQYERALLAEESERGIRSRYLTKPVGPSVLLQNVREMAPLRKEL